MAALTNLGPWERKRLRTSLEIEVAGLRLLADQADRPEHTGAGITVEQISAAAGISTRTFFRYFKNTRELVTGVPIRETERICDLVMARPPEEGLLEAFRAVFQRFGERQDERDIEMAEVELERQALALWTELVRADPDSLRSDSRVMTALADGLERVINDRHRLGPDSALERGALAAALAGAVWFVYVRWLETGSVGSLPAQLDSAFDALATLHETTPVIAGQGRPGGRPLG
jgi:AcrR family transcriptional regulator